MTSSDGAPVEIVQGTQGWFVTLTVADDASLPQLAFENDGAIITDRNWP